MSIKGYRRWAAGALAVTALAWGLGSEQGGGALARGLGPMWGGLMPAGMVSLTGTTAPCPRDGVPPVVPSRTAGAWHGGYLWRVTDCTTEAQRIPINLKATGTPASVTVTWTAPPLGGVTQYHLERSRNQGPFLEMAQPAGAATSYQDSTVTPNVVASYVYRLRAEYPGPVVSAPSHVDVATTIQFTDDGTLAGTTILALHLSELRAAVAAVCGTAGQTPPIWTDPTLTPQMTVIKKVHLEELRAKASECLAAVGVTAPSYTTDPTLTAGVTSVRKEHLQELRDAVH